MKYNKYFMVVLSIFLILFVFIGSASAADANGTDILSANDNNEIISTTIDNNEILTTGNDVSNYSELSKEITVGGQIELQHDYYKYDSGNTINIPNDSSIDGKGAVIDMAGSSIRAFIINGSNVIINNLTIKNVLFTYLNGGAIYSETGGIVTNCNFINNSADNGGAIYFKNVAGSVTNCNFINNSAVNDGAISFNDEASNVTNCTFINNSADKAGAIGFYNMDARVSNCTFVNNSAWYSAGGGAIFLSNGGSVDNCIFVNNSVLDENEGDGGAIASGGGSVNNCIFVNNYVIGGGGGAISIYGGSVTNCTFTGNSANTWGGAIDSYYVGVSVTNCTFTGNTISNTFENAGGYAIFSNGGSVTNCAFVNNSAKSGKYDIYSSFPYDSLDNNWWGSNEPDWDKLIHVDGYELTPPSSYAVLNVSAEPGEIGAGGKSDIITKFIWNDTDTDATNLLPKRHVNLSSEGNLTQTEGDVGLISAFYANDEDKYEVKAVVDNQKLEVKVKVSGSANSTDIFVNTDSLNLTVGETGSINATLNPPEAGNLTVNYDEKIIDLKLDSDGKWIVTGVAEGNTIITFSFLGSGQFTPAESKTVNVTVSLNDASVTVNNDTLDLEIGDTFVINATTMPEGLDVIYVPDESGVYSVDENGVVTALTNGTGSILVKVGGDGVYAENSTTVTVTVSKVPTEINITNETVDLKANGEVPTGATLTPADAGNLTYTSSNSSVAIVENGKIKGIGQGVANITVSFAGDDKYIAAENKTIAVSVSLADACVTVNNDTLDLKVGDTFVINATTSPEGLDVIYVPDESGVYSVDENGVVTALTNGTGSILVKVGGDGVHAENSTVVTVTVSLKDASVVADPDSLDLLVGETGKFYAVTDPEDLDIEVSSSNESVATVKLINRVPTVTAVGEGSAVITVSINERDYVKNSTTVNVKVVKIPTEILIQNHTLDMIIGDVVDPVVSLMPSDAGNITFISSDLRVASVDNKGIVTAVDEGNATVTVSFAGNEKYLPSNATITVSVRDALIVTAPDVVKYYGGPERFVVNVTDSKGTPLSNKSVTIVINKVTYNRTTDENGIASIGLNLHSGTYNATVTVDNKTVNSVVNVLTTVNGTDVVKMYKNDTQYYATFIDSEGNYLADGTVVKFNINGVMYERKISGGKGQAKLNINLPAGKYVITAMNPKTGEKESNNIVVLATIVENRDITKYYKNATQYTVKVLGADGNPVGAGKTVTFNINGVMYKKQTNESGIAQLNINLAPGDYVITASYEGYKVSNNIKVLPVLSASDL
ncbi:Ig-like domain-containing protein, partial [Methanobrevibacter sp.]|uniref:Ig-like domain-containing protein n=1 Tax=Methanobrevibacter sp. TaxID=66852 RepID=UPI002E76F12E